MVRMRVAGLTLDITSKTPLVILEGTRGEGVLPIWVGAMEAMAISLALSGKSLPRPLTHDLLGSILLALDSELLGVDITDLREGTYMAELHIRHGDKVHNIDCRPSDGIALALRAQAAICVAKDVLDRAGEATPTPDGTLLATINKPEDMATDMLRRAQGKPLTPLQPRFAGKDVLPNGMLSADADDDAHQFDQLLRDMEPDSKRRM